jgi:integrase
MAVYKPKRKGVESKYYVYEFVYQGKRFQGSAGVSTKTAAKEIERQRKAELERAHSGLPSEQRSKRILTVAEIVEPYLDSYALNHRESSAKFARTKLQNVVRLMRSVLLSDLTEDRIRQHIRSRKAEGVCGRTINMELGELSRAIGHTWKELWPRVRKLEERKDVGRALSAEEQARLLDAVGTSRSPVVRTAIPVLLLTGMRPGEGTSLRWGQIDLFEGVISVGRAKTSSGTGRTIPINDELAAVLRAHRRWFVSHFGEARDDQYLFPFGSPQPTNPNRPVTDISSGFDLARKAAGVKCRPHDLRHTFATQLAENGVPESTMLALMGHMSRAMLERYSHIRMRAKREALAGISLLRGRIERGQRGSFTHSRASRCSMISCGCYEGQMIVNLAFQRPGLDKITCQKIANHL